MNIAINTARLVWRLAIPAVSLLAAISSVRADTFIAADIQAGTSAAQDGFARWAIGTNNRNSEISKKFSNENGVSDAVTVSINVTTGSFIGVDQKTAAFGSDFQYSALYNDGVRANSGEASLTITFTGLSANTSYDFTFFLLDTGIASGTTSTTTVTYGSGSQLMGIATTYTAGDATNYNASTSLSVVATNGVAMTDASGAITFTISNATMQVMLNGFTVSTTPPPIPEPETAALWLGMAAIGLLISRRRLF
jgi:hypothetical protein